MNNIHPTSVIEDYLRVMSFTAFLACYASVLVVTFLSKKMIDGIMKFMPPGIGGSLLGTGILIFLAKKLVLLFVLWKIYKLGKMDEFWKAPMATLNKTSSEMVGWK